MTVTRSFILALLLVLLAIEVRADSGAAPTPSTGSSSKEKRSPRSQNGAYNLLIAGYYNGQGTATVTASSVTMTAQVQSDGGPTLTFKSDTLQINGQYFQGTGTIGNTKMTIKGRLDAASASRLTATFKTNDNRRGLIAGTLPTDPPNPNWNNGGGGGGGGGAGGNPPGGGDGDGDKGKG